MLKYALGAVAVILLMLAIAAILFLPKQTEPPIVEPPCSELTWMRDLPQARCKAYWKQRDIDEAR